MVAAGKAHDLAVARADAPHVPAGETASPLLDVRALSLAFNTMENALSAPIAFQYELDALGTKVKGYVPDLLGKPKFENINLA